MKLIELVYKRTDISDERFHYHWKVIHGPLGQGMVHLVRYIQLHRIAPALPGLPTLACEGIVEGWFKSMETVEATFVDPAYLEHTKPDEELFLEQDQLTAVFADEELLVPGAPDRPEGAKATLALRRRADVPAVQFLGAWRAFTERLIEVSEPVHVSRSVAREAEYEDGKQPCYDGFDFIAWENLETLERAWAADPVRDLLPSLGEFADLTRSAGHVAEEYRVTWPS